MIRRLCLAVLLVLLALPAYAGHGTIRETDTAIIVEYTGDDNEMQASKVLKEEEQKMEQKIAASEEKIKTYKQEKSEMKAARKAERHKGEE